MKTNEEYESVADRIKSAQPRVHSDLTDTARERLLMITSNPTRAKTTEKYLLPETCIELAIRETCESVGTSPIESKYNETHSSYGKHSVIIEECNRDAVLTYVENLLREIHDSQPVRWNYNSFPDNPNERLHLVRSGLEQTVEKVNTAMETEGILWKLKDDNNEFNFYPIGSELMQNSDQELSVIGQGERWSSVISPYNEAYNQYLDRTYDWTIPEKLYNSIEELCRTICVDLERWENNREQNLSVYLETMRENDLFEPNNIMMAELTDLSKSMERTFQKAGAERKNRHSEIDREYATLLLHQVSAYLTYLIRQYEEKFE